MESEIRSFINTSNGSRLINIFGYTSRGIPGFEVHGLGKHNKEIKEKLIYLTRLRKIRVPPRRVVINIDTGEYELKSTDKNILWLDYPILLLYWYLIGILPIKQLNDCIAIGKVSVQGEIEHGLIPNDLLKSLGCQFNPVEMRQLKLIGAKKINCGLWNIDSKLLLEHIPQLSFK